jgi:hypothetical protein
MNERISNELEPITMTDGSFWRQVAERLVDNPTKVQPVILKDPDSNLEVGKFFTSLVAIGPDRYLHLEFTSKILENAFVSTSRGIEFVQEGIYRIKIS